MTVLLEGDHLTKQYGGVAAVQDVSFQISSGELVGLIGPNGAGKTTLFNTVSGFTPPTSGSVRWKGEDITKVPAPRRVERGMVRTFQQARVFRSLSIRDNLRIACHTAATSSFAGDLVAAGRSRRADALIDERVDQLIDVFQLGSIASVRGDVLSYGQAKRLGLVMGAASEPELLMLDEPAAGLNNVEITELRVDLERLRDAGITIWLVEHHMGLVMGVSDRVMVLEAGQKIADDTPAVISEDQRVIDAYLGATE
ncbi:MAG: ABC transporter ATP-binding protein [Acidimicrobiia bacterium]